MKLRLVVRRFVNLSTKKKLSAFFLLILFISILVAAYSQIPWLMVLLALGFGIVLCVIILQLDRALKTSRLAARRGIAEYAKLASTKPSPRPGALIEWGARSRIAEPRLAQRLTKLRSVDGRDILVSAATSGQWVWQDLAIGLEMYRIGGKSRRTVQPVLDNASRSFLLHLGDICFRQNVLQDDILNAATLYRYVYQRLGAKAFAEKRRGEFFLDALARTGQGEEVLRLEHLYKKAGTNANDLHLYRSNAVNPFKNENSEMAEWLEEINVIYQREGLSLITLTVGSDSAFLRLDGEKSEAVSVGPLITVVMPVYRPDAYTDLAIQSALNQTYRNIEIIIVDDGSGGDVNNRLKKWLEKDPRVQVVLNEHNAGAYTSRNVGYSMAQGEFITIFDGDDWQHPQKIELLVRNALQQKDRRLVSAPWTRADEDLFFYYRGWKGAFVTPSHVSTMFHTETLREQLGYWDSVRKAADTEFILRYQALVNNAEPLEVSQAPLTISLVGESNLSMEDFRLGYRSPDRVSYRDSYEYWHKMIQDGLASGYLDFPLNERAFPAPSRFLPSGTFHQGIELDSLFVGDFGASEVTQKLMMEHLASAVLRGDRIGLMHYPSILHATSIDRSFSDELKNAFHKGKFRRVEVTDRVKSAAVNVYDPTAFQYSRELRSGHSASKVFVWTAEPPYNWETDKHKYEIGTVERNLLSVFGARINWVPLNDRTLRIISESGHGQKSIGEHTMFPDVDKE